MIININDVLTNKNIPTSFNVRFSETLKFEM